MKISTDTRKTIETIIKRIVIVSFIGVLSELFYTILNYNDVSKGEKLGIASTILIAMMSLMIMLINEMSKNS